MQSHLYVILMLHYEHYAQLMANILILVVSARDAWIQADANRYAGSNKCILWKAFASRGLGVGAANFVDSSAIPAGC